MIDWTPELDADLLRLIDREGLSKREAAEAMGMARNAVCGRYWRVKRSRGAISSAMARHRAALERWRRAIRLAISHGKSISAAVRAVDADHGRVMELFRREYPDQYAEYWSRAPQRRAEAMQRAVRTRQRGLAEAPDWFHEEMRL